MCREHGVGSSVSAIQQGQAGHVGGRHLQLPGQLEAASLAYISASEVCLRPSQALDSYVPGAAVGQSGAATITAQALNEETHEQAMFMVDPASLLHYRDRGKQLVAGPDRQGPSLRDTMYTHLSKECRDVFGSDQVGFRVLGKPPWEDH